MRTNYVYDRSNDNNDVATSNKCNEKKHCGDANQCNNNHSCSPSNGCNSSAKCNECECGGTQKVCPPGPIGPQGPQGPQGFNGATGANGITPNIGANGNWFIGGVDTGISSQGLTGATGDIGAVGATGATGDMGAVGATGETGDIGPVGATGDIGLVGATGATGSFASNFAYIINNNIFTSTIPNEPVPLDTNIQIVGTDISHVNGSTDIILAANHCYLVNWSANENPPFGTAYYVELLLDGVVVPGSAANDAAVLGSTGRPIRGRSSIVCTGATAGVLQIAAANIGATFPSAIAPPQDSNVSITIVELV